VSTEALSAALEPPCCYGKLPSRGDFVTRRFERAFIDAWDIWLQQAIVASRAQLNERWLDFYLTSPIWHFALGAGSCGPRAVLGVVIPSVDSVGRYFPLMLGRALPGGSDTTATLKANAGWYRAIEALTLAALDWEFKLERLDEPIEVAVAATAAAGPETAAPPAPGRHWAVAASPGESGQWPEEVSAGPSRSLWWTAGSERVAPCLIACSGLPAPAAFAALMDGDWLGREWLSTSLVPEPPPADETPPAAAETPGDPPVSP
jgi:type VI secretion system protein ImpM